MYIPIGCIANVIFIIVAGIIGTLIGKHLPEELKDKLSFVFGLCSFGMGFGSISLMKNMPAVILSLIVGTIIGVLIRLGEMIHKGATFMQKMATKIMKSKSSKSEKDNMTFLVTLIIIFCFGSTGIYGSLVSGMTGDQSIILCKGILDLFSATIFACSLGIVISLIAVPQAIIYGILFYSASFILPIINDNMICDFKACGGLIIFATGFTMLNIANFPVADMLPAMVIVMPLSYVWENYIVPLIV